ncbi:hypothetical protein [Caldiplasma sukawensis]
MNPVRKHVTYAIAFINLHERGVEEPVLFIADGLPGIEEEVKQMHQKGGFPLFVFHISEL